MTSPAGKSSKTPRKNGGPTVPPAPDVDWLGRLAQFWFKIEHFVWDVVGVMLLALAVILLLGLVGLTQGSVLTPIISLLDRGFGWGSFLAVAFIASLGLMGVRRKKQPEAPLPLGRLLLLEGWGFSLLALLAAAGGSSLELADKGYGGGLVGWGLHPDGLIKLLS